MLPEPAAATPSKPEDADTTEEGYNPEAEHEQRTLPCAHHSSVPPPNDFTIPPEPAAEPQLDTIPEEVITSEHAPTTAMRPPMRTPSTLHVHITATNLNDYVGPPIYHQDRLYSKPPPTGVSTGLGYLGNGSGAVIPIEAIVRALFFISFKYTALFLHFISNIAYQVRVP